MTTTETINGRTGPELEGWLNCYIKNNPYPKGSPDWWEWEDGKEDREFADRAAE